MYWPFTFRQLALFGIVALSIWGFFYELGRGSGLLFAASAAIIEFAICSALLFGWLALWDFLKRMVKRYKRPAESKESAESTKGRRYRRLR